MEKKTERIKFWLSDKELKELDSKAKKAGMGNLFKPDTVTEQFGKLLKKYGLRKIRFHDLRHSCASLLLAKHIPMKMIQDWLGHSDIQTTANIYSHLDAQSKQESAAVIGEALKM